MVTSNCNLFIPKFFDRKSILGPIYTSQSLNLLLSLASKLISMSNDCLEMRFC